MTNKSLLCSVLVPSWLLVMGASILVSGKTNAQIEYRGSPAVSAQPAAADVKGTWSGAFFSRHSNVRSFTMTVVINADSRGHLVGNSSLNSDCMKGAQLEVTVTGSQVVLAGSSDAGDNITVRGTVDSTGTLLRANYILNGSATGSCETDDGTGSLAKR
jgi:hypothetical protein